MKPAAIIFDFDGVLIESEHLSAQQVARTLSELGHPTTVEQCLQRFTGLGGQDFLDAIAAHTGAGVPAGFGEARRVEDERVLREGVPAVAGALDFVRALPATLPRAVASSSTTHWIRTHLDHLALREQFEPHIYSGREDVARGKPAPDIYLHAAARLGTDIARCVIIEDSSVGVVGAIASGAMVIGLVAGQHCDAHHADLLRSKGVQHIARNFEDVRRLLA